MANKKKNAREFLETIRELDKLIETYTDELNMLIAKLTSTTSKQNEVNVMVSKEDMLPENVEKLIKLQNNVKDIMDEFTEMRIEADRVLTYIKNPKIKMVIVKYYFQKKNLEQIAVDMDHSYQWVCRLKEQGIREFDKFLYKMY